MYKYFSLLLNKQLVSDCLTSFDGTSFVTPTSSSTKKELIKFQICVLLMNYTMKFGVVNFIFHLKAPFVRSDQSKGINSEILLALFMNEVEPTLLRL